MKFGEKISLASIYLFDLQSNSEAERVQETCQLSPGQATDSEFELGCPVLHKGLIMIH